MATSIGVDLTDPALYRRGVPHDVFAELRAAGPVHRHPPARLAFAPGQEVEFWSVVGHDAIQEANRDWQTFSAIDGPGLLPLPAPQRGTMLVSMDPPDHTRLRRLISAGFTPRMVAALERHIEQRATAVLDAAGEAGTCDLVTDVAWQLPMHVIADIIGIPEDDRPRVFAMTTTILAGLDPATGVTDEERDGASVDLFLYAQALADEKRATPADDVWTTLTQAEVPGEDGALTTLSGLELDMFFLILALAGSETTRNAIAGGVLALLERPDQLAALRADPVGLRATATDEIIRWVSPVLMFGRTATTDVALAGTEIAAGDRVALWYPSGNRDEAAFASPSTFDVARRPNPHVSFGGGGPHHCLGANLAKTEVSVLVPALVSRFDVELEGDPVWGGPGPAHSVGVSLDHLPVRLTPRR